jgi:hypothetical protein
MAVFACLASVVAGMAFAKGPSTHVQVFAELYLREDGSVDRVAVDSPAQPVLVSLVERAVSGWRFDPVVRDGVATRVRTGMTLDLEGTPVDGGLAALRIAKVKFDAARGRHAKILVPLLQDSFQVLAAIRVDAQGNVTDTAVLYLGNHGRNVDTLTRREVSEAFARSLRRSKLRPADLAHGEPADQTMLLPIDFLAMFESQSKLDPERRFREMKPVPWLDAAHQPSILTFARLDASGSAIALEQEDVKLRSSVIGTLLCS